MDMYESWQVESVQRSQMEAKWCTLAQSGLAWR